MPDQRVVLSTLSRIEESFASLDSQRPPGMIVVGWAILALSGKGHTDVLDAESIALDDGRIANWLGDSNFKIIEGLSTDIDSI
jgi:uroporphyrin-III C-methyltransferase